jgi:hypothetical protein
MKPLHYLFMAGAAALVLAGGSSKAPSAEEPKSIWPGDTITDQMRADGAELLKEAYRLNGDSMNAWGAYESRTITIAPPVAPPVPFNPVPKK